MLSKRMLAFLFLLSISPIGFYCYHFKGAPFSGNPADWGAFGSYISGSFTFALFIGAIVTLWTQKQTEESKKESEESEIYLKVARSFLKKAHYFISKATDMNAKYDLTEDYKIKRGLLWDCSARLILNAEYFAQKINSTIRKEEYHKIEEYWIVKFRSEFNLDMVYPVESPSGESLMVDTYFENQKDNEWVSESLSGVSEMALITIFKFLEKEPVNDLLKKVTKEDLSQKELKRLNEVEYFDLKEILFR